VRIAHAPPHTSTTGKILRDRTRKTARRISSGATVQVSPHITDEIKSCVSSVPRRRSRMSRSAARSRHRIAAVPSRPSASSASELVRRHSVLYIHLSWCQYLGRSQNKTKPHASTSEGAALDRVSSPDASVAGPLACVAARARARSRCSRTRGTRRHLRPPPWTTFTRSECC